MDKTVVRASSGTFYPNDGYDDASERGTGAFSLSENDIYFRRAADEEEDLYFCGGTRYDPVNIPQGSTINDAKVYVYFDSVTYDSPNAKIYGHDVDNSQDFNDLQDIFDRTRTTNYTEWIGANIGYDQWFNKDVTDVVQEIIDRGGWESGDPLTLLWIANFGADSPARFRSIEIGEGSHKHYLTVTWSPPVDAITYHDIEAPNEEGYYVYTPSDSYFWLNSTLEVEGGTEHLVNCTIGLNQGIVLKYDNATDTFSEYTDPSNYIYLDTGNSDKIDVNSTFMEIGFRVKLLDNASNGYEDALVSSTIAHNDYGNNATYYENDLILFLNSSIVLSVEDTVFHFGVTNSSSTERFWDYDGESVKNLIATFDDSTHMTRSLSDFGDTETNYATLYIIDHDFCFGWSTTIYDVYRNQSYECIGEAGYLDWNYNGLFPPPGVPESFPSEIMPWYVPIIGYLAAVLLPFMIIAYYWNKARDWKTGLMVLFVCIMCYILFLTLWNLSDALMYWLYR